MKAKNFNIKISCKKCKNPYIILDVLESGEIELTCPVCTNNSILQSG